MTNQEKNREAILSKVKALSSILTEYTSNLKEHNATQIAEELLKDKKVSLNLDYLRKIVAEFCRQNNIALPKGKRTTEVPPEFKDSRVKGSERESGKKEKEPEKPTFEIKDRYVINWANKTIVTDLGEFSSYVASFSRHRLIQNAYVDSGSGETAAIVAMKFNFPNAKAVYLYAKIHDFTKSSIPQTNFDLENELVDPEEAINENMQALKLKIYKGTELRKWKETEKAASQWWNFENTILESLQVLMSELPDIKAGQLDFIIPPTDFRFASIIGISDVHYTKICYNNRGEITYNREIAKATIEEHTKKLAEETGRYGRPEHFYVIVGNDNMHVDNILHTTTRGTPQLEAVDGLWRMEFKNYVKIQIELIEYYKQISKVIIVPVKGNHDYQTSIAIQAFLDIYYSNDPLVEVLTCLHDRIYVQYETNCFIFTHGDELRSIAKLEKEAHKLIMSEAKEQGINIQEVENYFLIHGHLHAGSMNDIGGFVERICLQALHAGEDIWHVTNGYIGRSRRRSQVIHFEPEFGKKGISYV